MEIVWKPFLPGPIFKAQGWDTSPFKLYPAKGKYMVRAGAGNQGEVAGKYRRGAGRWNFRRAKLHNQGGELFWGDGRLEQTLVWSLR